MYLLATWKYALKPLSISWLIFLAKSAKFSRDKIFACLEDMRVTIDELERTVSKKYWKLPTYGDMLYSLS